MGEKTESQSMDWELAAYYIISYAMHWKNRSKPTIRLSSCGRRMCFRKTPTHTTKQGF